MHLWLLKQYVDSKMFSKLKKFKNTKHFESIQKQMEIDFPKIKVMNYGNK